MPPNDALSTALDEAAQDLIKGHPIEALRSIAALLAANSSDPRPYRAGFEALSAAVVQPGTLDAWDGTEKPTFYRHLLLQPDCPERPLIFHHGLASLLTSQNLATVSAVVSEIKPVLHELLENDGSLPSELILFMLVARSFLSDVLSVPELSEVHIEAFPDFEPDDLALPYSVVFNENSFGANRDDLLRQFADPAMALDPAVGLRLSHLVLLDWLGIPDLFQQMDNSDLLATLRSRLTGSTHTHTQSERAAAHSLILRHWRPGSVITAEIVKSLGLDDGLITIAQTLDPLTKTDQLDPAGQRLESRPWQAARLVKSLVGHAVPFLHGRRKMRVALCVSGQLRGFEEALKSWQHTLLDAADCDVFVHAWAVIGQASAQPFRSVLPFAGETFCAEWRRVGTLAGYETLQARYPTIFSKLEAGARIDASQLQPIYNTQTVIVDDENDPRFAAFSNQDKMHYKISAAHDLAVASGKDYDLFVRIRPDLSLRYRGFDWKDMAQSCAAEPKLYCDRAFGVHFGHPMIGDQLAIGSAHTMAKYAATWRSQEKLADIGLAGLPSELTGHVSLAQSCWVNGIKAVRVPIKLGTLCAPLPLSTKEIANALELDMTGRSDAFDTDLMSAALRDINNGN